MDPQGLWLGVEIAEAMALVVAIDGRGEVVDTRRVLEAPTPERVAAACAVLAARWQVPVRGLGLCADDLGRWRELAAPLAAQLLSVGAARALGEARKGALRGARDVLVVHLGWRLHAGVLRGGEPLGQPPLHVELGHLAIDPGGERCSCGARGCLQTWISEAAWQRRITAARLPLGDHRMQLHQPPVQTALLEGAELGDLASAQLVAWPLELLARATALLATAFGVDAAAVQWPLTEPPQRLHRDLEARVRQLQPRLGGLALGRQAALGGAWGAALWAQQRPSLGALS